MANPTSIGGLFTNGVFTTVDYKPAVCLASSVELVVPLNPNLDYILYHDGEDEAGSAQTAVVRCAFSGSVDNDASEGSDKAKLRPNLPLPIGPGISVLKLRTASVNVTVTVAPRLNYYGDF